MLKWEPPAENIDGTSPPNLVGYLINSSVVVVSAEFEEKNFEFGKALTYRAQSITRSEDPVILSVPSDPLTIVPEDTFAPQPPSGLNAVQLGDDVQVIWNAGFETDLQGYFVYRRALDAAFEKVSPLVSVNRFLDDPAPVSTVIYYVVTAVDKWGNESDRSDEVSVELARD
jgi:hypothetical protein